MAVTDSKIPPERRVTLEPQASAGDGILLASYVWKTYRFMMDDGSTVDVMAVRDDSDLRSAVLDLTKAKAIVGVATLPEVAKVPASAQEPGKTTKRVAKRQKPV